MENKLHISKGTSAHASLVKRIEEEKYKKEVLLTNPKVIKEKVETMCDEFYGSVEFDTLLEKQKILEELATKEVKILEDTQECFELISINTTVNTIMYEDGFYLNCKIKYNALETETEYNNRILYLQKLSEDIINNYYKFEVSEDKRTYTLRYILENVREWVYVVKINEDKNFLNMNRKFDRKETAFEKAQYITTMVSENFAEVIKSEIIVLGEINED